MKKFLILLFLTTTIFQPLTKADNIRDFQIEGMSLYESALKYFTKSKIKINEEDYYKKKTYKTSTISSPKFKVYEDVQISYKTNDNEFILLDISGIVEKNYKSCISEIKKISLDFDKMFPNTKFENLLEYKNSSDKSGESKISDMFWEFENGDKILLACYKFDTKYGKDNKFADELRISISSKEFDKFLINEG